MVEKRTTADAALQRASDAIAKAKRLDDRAALAAAVVLTVCGSVAVLAAVVGDIAAREEAPPEVRAAASSLVALLAKVSR